MRRPLFAFLPAVLLAACAAGTLPPANPSRVTLLSDTLAVHFFDGSVCRADIRPAASGRSADCPQAMDYAVVVHHPALAANTPLAPLFEPYATITLDRPADGRHWGWQTPQPGEGTHRSTPTSAIHYF